MQLQEIAERCQQGDREAFALLYTAMRQPLRAVCLHYVHDEAVADDLLHDAFLLVFFQIGKLKDTARTEAWMTMVMRRVSLLYLRKQRRQSQKLLSSCPATSLQHLTVENRAESVLAVREILAAVDALPEGYRRVFRLFVLEGMTHQEIADLLNIEAHSSSSQLVHAKILLRRWLRQMCLVLLVVALPLGIYLWHSRDKSPSQPATHSVGAGPVPVCHPQNKDISPSQPISVSISSMVQTVEQEHRPAETDSCGPTPATVPEQERTDCHETRLNSIDDGQMPVATFKRKVSDWTLAVTYSGMGNGGNLQLPYADHETNPMVFDSVAHHHIPLTVSIMLNRKLDSHWQVGAGLRYQRMTSDMLSGNTYVALSQHQVVQYIGIPLSVSWHYPLGRRFSTYLSASASVSLPLRSTLESVWLMDVCPLEPTTEHLHPAVQWSAGMGVGLQYNLTPHVGLFAEPGLQYHFNGSGDNVKTWNTEHPFALEVPFGLRISF